jgi:hypothetical protein
MVGILTALLRWGGRGRTRDQRITTPWNPLITSNSQLR